MKDLVHVEPAWVQLLDDEDGEQLTVLELDEAVVEGAPWPGYPTQLAVSVALHDLDPQGQPYDDEHAALLLLRSALENALGQDGRLVAVITLDGVREHVAYVRSPDVVQGWRNAPPPEFADHDLDVELLEDPDWVGLREIAGLLGADEVPLRPPGS
ncbi:MAG: DUF695 domain-containing protein [Frankiales bacterium]|nr:DUF695 domain-containing protein [Frankiales bacterium]